MTWKPKREGRSAIKDFVTGLAIYELSSIWLVLSWPLWHSWGAIVFLTMETYTFARINVSPTRIVSVRELIRLYNPRFIERSDRRSVILKSCRFVLFMGLLIFFDSYVSMNYFPLTPGLRVLMILKFSYILVITMFCWFVVVRVIFIDLKDSLRRLFHGD